MMRHTNSIEVTNRQIGWLVAIVIVFSLGSFSAGYFLGEKKSAERFIQRVEQDALADQLYSSICSLYENESEPNLRTRSGSTESPDGETVKEKEKENEEVTEETATETIFCAQLVGFGTAKKAKQFVERLAKKGVTTHVRERKSKTARGKTIVWYQVVTDLYTNKNVLIGLVEKVKQEERLHDVRIVTI